MTVVEVSIEVSGEEETVEAIVEEFEKKCKKKEGRLLHLAAMSRMVYPRMYDLQNGYIAEKEKRGEKG